MELPVLVAIFAVIILVLFASGAFKSGKKSHHKKEHSSSSSSSTHSPAAAKTDSVASSAAEKEKKGPKKKNRSNKTKAQKARAKAAAAAAATSSSSVAAASASEAENNATDKDDSHDEASDESSDEEDAIPSGIRFQTQQHLAQEKAKAKKAQLLDKEKHHHIKQALKAAKEDAAAAPVHEDALLEPVPQHAENAPAAHFDGWAVVGKTKAKKTESEEQVSAPASPVPEVIPEPAPVAVTPPAPVIETITSEMKVDPKKVGLLIGPKGVTKIAIQDLTGTKINVPKVEKEVTEAVPISVVGPALGVSKAVHALNELITKGYATLLEADDFSESYVAVHPRYLPDIIGKGGATIRTLQKHTDVKITVPSTPKTPQPDGKISKVKIGLAGRKEKVSQARALIKDLTKYYHTPITHPGVVHDELELDSKYFNFIIGAKGSEIKNIQNTHKVSVHIPNADSANPNLVIVGSEQGVAAARKHIEKIIDRVDGVGATPTETVVTPAAAVETPEVVTEQPEVVTPPAVIDPVPIVPVSTGSAWGSNTKSRLPLPPQAEDVPAADEAWMSEFVPPSGGMDLSSMLPATAKFAPQPMLQEAAPRVSALNAGPAPVDPTKKAPSVVPSAWNNLSSLPNDKW
eukprot:gene3761-4111_t